VRRDPPAENGVRARVVELVYRGDHVDVGADCGLRARVPPSAAPAAGEEVWLELPSAHLEALRD
jgi:hypothetical protein